MARFSEVSGCFHLNCVLMQECGLQVAFSISSALFSNKLNKENCVGFLYLLKNRDFF